MKLDISCIRDILLFLESEPFLITNDSGDIEVSGVWFPQIRKALPQYPQEQIYYTLARLDEAGFLDLSTQWAGDSMNLCCVNYITFSGHEFLEKVRPPTVWEKTSGIAGKLGSFSLDIIEKIAEGVASAYIDRMLSGN